MLRRLRERRNFTEDRRRFPLLNAVCLLVGCLLCAPLLHAEETGEYFFELLPDGTPRFTQVLRWEADPNVLYYEISLQTGAGENIFVSKVTEPLLRLNLTPGEYRYRIVLYNLLKKPEQELPWQSFSVLKAEIPRIARYEPKLWFIEDSQISLTLQGENLIPGASVVLKRGGSSAEPAAGTEAERDGTSSVSVSFPTGSLAAGEYSIALTNPGGLSVEVPAAILVRHKLPEPKLLTPAAGSVFGPAELRGTKSIGFSWEAVPEAARYVFCLYASGDPERVVCRKLLSTNTYLLDDLTVLDRGEFRWSVEAQGSDGEGGTIPAVRAAEAGFRVELPHLAAPALSTPGDTFYGR